MVKKTVTSDKWLVASKIGRVAFLLSLLTVHSSLLFAQQPQAQAGQQIYPVNAKFVQGIGPGYWPTAGSNLTLNLAPGTAVCSNVVQTYAGGTLTLAASATNYVYLDAANSCAPATNTTGFTSTTIPIARVVTNSTAISSITDVRTMFTWNVPTGSGSVSSVGMTGDGIVFNPVVSSSPVTSSGTLAPQLLTQTANTVLAGPGLGVAATPTFRALVPADLPASITSNTSGNAATASALASNPTQCSGNAWATGVSASGNANCSQPGFSNLTGTLGLGQTPLTTAGDLLFTNSTPGLARLPIGATNQFLGVSSGLPAWLQPSFGNLSGTAAISQGGTGQTTASAAFNALSPLTTEGDLHYYHSSLNARLAIGSANTFLTSNGTDPSWDSLTGAGFGSQTANNFLAAPNGSNGNPSFRGLVAADLPSSITSNTSGNAATATALAAPPAQCTGSALAVGIAASGNANCIGSQTANTFYAAPNGSSGAPAFRALVGSDLPTISVSGGGTGQTTSSAAFNALSPLSTEGDLNYYHSNTNGRLGIGSNGQCLTSNGTDPVWGSCSTGSGTVTSVGLSLPSLFSVAGSPVTGSGTLAATLANQNANLIMAGPSSGSSSAPAFRALVGADLPAPSASTLGGIQSVSCNPGLFVSQISTAGVPTCAMASGPSSGIGNGYTVIDASQQAGSDFGSKINAAIAALPSTGGTVDARGLGGSQSMNTSVVLGSDSQPITLLLPTGTITRASGVVFKFYMGSHVIGQGVLSTLISGNDASTTFAYGNGPTGAGAWNVLLQDFDIHNYTAGGTCIDFSNVSQSEIARVVGVCQTGLVMGSGGGTGGSYYNSVWDYTFVPPPTLNSVGWAIKLTQNANSNDFHGGRPGARGNASILALPGSFNNNFWHPDMESIDLPFMVYDASAVAIHDPYFEGNGSPSSFQVWQASTAYQIGAVIQDANGNGEVATTAGTSGATAPAVWGSTLGATTADGTVVWTLFNPSGQGEIDVLFTNGAAGNIVEGGGTAGVRDLTCTTLQSCRNKTDLVYNGPQYLAANNGLLFGPDPSNYSNGDNYYLGMDALELPGGSPGYVLGWGIDNEFNPVGFQCVHNGECGHAPLHAGQVNATGGTQFWGPILSLPLPNPAAPTVKTYTSGSTAVTYGLVAHCNGGVTQPGSFSTSVNVTGPSSSNPVTIQLPSLFTTPYSINTEHWSGNCTWDILKGDTAHSIATGVRPGNGVFQDSGQSLSAYTAPTRNSTGDAYFNANVYFQGQQAYLGTVGSNYFFDVPGNSGDMIFGWNSPQPGGTGGTRFAVMDNSTTRNTMFWVTSAGTGGGSPGVFTLHNTLEDGSGNMSVANKVTASQFCIGSNCVASLWSNPMTTLGDFLYGGTGGAATRLAIGGANAFLTSNGTVPSWGPLTGAGFGSQPANCFLAAPNGSSGNMSCRAMLAADVPTLNQSTTGNAATATALAATPTQCGANQFSTGIAAGGNANCASQANADWNATSGVAQILNKPTVVNTVNGNSGAVTLNTSNLISTYTWRSGVSQIGTCSSTVSGVTAYVSDVGDTGSYWTCSQSFHEGTWQWVPQNGRVTLAISGIPFVIPSSGSMGNNGALTLTTALPRTYSSGAYMYFPAGAIASGSAAGLYWTVMSSATTGTVYNNRYYLTVGTLPSAASSSGVYQWVSDGTSSTDCTTGGGSNFVMCYSNGTSWASSVYTPPPAAPASNTAFSTTGPGAYTQTTGSYIMLAAYIVQGSLMGLRGQLVMQGDWNTAGTTNTKTAGLLYGTLSNLTFQVSSSSNAGWKSLFFVKNMESASVQEAFTGWNGYGAGGGFNFFGYNTANPEPVQQQGKLATATDFIVEESWDVQLVRP